MFKKFIQSAFNKFGYEIRKSKSSFSINNNLNWLDFYNIETIFDVGANDGGFAVFINGLLPNRIIYSFEPIKECFEILSAKSLRIPKLKPFNFALGDADEEVDFNLNAFSYSSSFLSLSETSIINFPQTSNQTIVKAQVKRLDSIYNELNVIENVLVKIDVQGFEKRVLQGGVEFFRNIPKIVILEISIKNLYENEPSFKEIYELMGSWGYSYKGNIDQLYSPINGEILQVDAIFVK